MQGGGAALRHLDSKPQSNLSLPVDRPRMCMIAACLRFSWWPSCSLSRPCRSIVASQPPYLIQQSGDRSCDLGKILGFIVKEPEGGAGRELQVPAQSSQKKLAKKFPHRSSELWPTLRHCQHASVQHAIDVERTNPE